MLEVASCMALLHQFFRLRGAPRSGKPPVTLGALLDAMPVSNGGISGDADAFPLDAAPASATGSGDSAPEVPSSPVSISVAANHIPATPEAIAPRVRFNPFATERETESGGSPKPQGQVGPCMEDPTLPPLRLEARVPNGAGECPVILGEAAIGAAEGAPDLRQIPAPAARLAPIKSPAASLEMLAAKPSRPLLVRLEIEADPSLDVVAFKQHAAKFPGVVKCVISHAHD